MLKSATLAIIAAFSLPSSAPDPLRAVDVCLTVQTEARDVDKTGSYGATKVTNPCTGGSFFIRWVAVSRPSVGVARQ